MFTGSTHCPLHIPWEHHCPLHVHQERPLPTPCSPGASTAHSMFTGSTHCPLHVPREHHCPLHVHREHPLPTPALSVLLSQLFSIAPSQSSVAHKGHLVPIVSSSTARWLEVNLSLRESHCRARGFLGCCPASATKDGDVSLLPRDHGLLRLKQEKTAEGVDQLLSAPVRR